MPAKKKVAAAKKVAKKVVPVKDTEEDIKDTVKDTVEETAQPSEETVKDIKDTVKDTVLYGEKVLLVEERIMNGRLYKDVRTVAATYLLTPEEYEKTVTEA